MAIVVLKVLVSAKPPVKRVESLSSNTTVTVVGQVKGEWKHVKVLTAVLSSVQKYYHFSLLVRYSDTLIENWIFKRAAFACCEQPLGPTTGSRVAVTLLVGCVILGLGPRRQCQSKMANSTASMSTHKRTSGAHCMAPGCSNTYYKESNVHYHRLPTDTKREAVDSCYEKKPCRSPQSSARTHVQCTLPR